MLLGPVVPDRMDPDDLTLDAELNGVGDDTNLGAATPPRVSHPIVGAGKRYVAGGVHHSSHGHSVGGLPRPAAALPQRYLLRLAGVGFAALHMFGDQHLTVEDPHK
jgi:hypothetical protein